MERGADGGGRRPQQQPERERQQQPARRRRALLPGEQPEREKRQGVLEGAERVEDAAVEVAEAVAQAVGMRGAGPGGRGEQSAAKEQLRPSGAQGMPMGAARITAA
jgi:hypothetical protein